MSSTNSPPPHARVVAASTVDGPPFVGALLRLAHQRVRARLNEAIIAAGFDDLQESHFPVFSYPAPDAVRPLDLARRLGVSRQALNHLLGQLETLGYLERRVPPDGGRRLVYLTERGWRVCEPIFACLRDIQAEWAREIGPQRFAEFMNVLRKVALDQETNTLVSSSAD